MTVTFNFSPTHDFFDHKLGFLNRGSQRNETDGHSRIRRMRNRFLWAHYLPLRGDELATRLALFHTAARPRATGFEDPPKDCIQSPRCHAI
jgi:hypothetical protein